MFLTRKEWIGVLIKNCLWIVISALCGVAVLLLLIVGKPFVWMVVLGGIALFFGIVGFPIGYYAKGVAPLVVAGRKAINFELRPMDFIILYDQKRSDPGNVVARPHRDVLIWLFTAYAMLRDNENALKTVDAMLSAVPARQKAAVTVLRMAVFYDLGRKEEADDLLAKLQSGPVDARTRRVIDIVMKTSRAEAHGEWEKLEAFYRPRLSLPPKKTTPFLLADTHFELAIVCEKTGRPDEAKMHYTYCAEHGGQTYMQKKAAEWLKDR